MARLQLLFTLIILATAVGVGSIICHGVMREAVKGALGIILVATLLTPFLGALKGFFELEIPEIGNGSYGEFDEITALAFSEGVRDAIVDEFSVSGDVRVIVRDFDPAQLRAESITVIIPTSAALVDFRAVREYTERNFSRDGGCEVLYG